MSGSGTPTHLPPPPYPGFSPSHSPSPGGPHPPPASPGFYPPQGGGAGGGGGQAKPVAAGAGMSPGNPMGQMMMPAGFTPSGSTAAVPTSAAPAADPEDKVRFQVELEFVQCLGNPNYLNFLAQRGYFKDPAMINYLSYLCYWKEPAYVKFIKFPVCLHFLELLQHEAFRKEIANGAVSLLLCTLKFSRRR